MADHAKLPRSKQEMLGRAQWPWRLLLAEGALKHSWSESKPCSNAMVSLGQELSSLSLQERGNFQEKNTSFASQLSLLYELIRALIFASFEE